MSSIQNNPSVSSVGNVGATQGAGGVQEKTKRMDSDAAYASVSPGQSRSASGQSELLAGSDVDQAPGKVEFDARMASYTPAQREAIQQAASDLRDTLPPVSANRPITQQTIDADLQTAVAGAAKSYVGPPSVTDDTGNVTDAGATGVKTQLEDTLNAGLDQIHADMADFAVKLKNRIDTKTQMGTDKENIQAALDNPAEFGPGEQTFRVTTWDGEKGQPKVEYIKADPSTDAGKTTLGDAKAKISDTMTMVQVLNEQDSLKIQNLAQDEQRMITLLSNLSKLNHDTLKSIIGNIRG